MKCAKYMHGEEVDKNKVALAEARRILDQEDIPNCSVGLLKCDEGEAWTDNNVTFNKDSAVVKGLLPPGWSGKPSESSEMPKQSAAKDAESSPFDVWTVEFPPA